MPAVDLNMDISSMNQKEADAYVTQMLRRLMYEGREAAKAEIAAIRDMGELYGRMIFLSSAGSIPDELQELVQSVLLPNSPPAKSVKTLKENGNGGN